MVKSIGTMLEISSGYLPVYNWWSSVISIVWSLIKRIIFNYLKVHQIGIEMQYLQSLVSVELDVENIKRESIELFLIIFSKKKRE